VSVPDPNMAAQGLDHPLRGKGGEVAKRSNAADCKSAGLRPSEVRILPSPPERPRPGRRNRLSELDLTGQTGQAGGSKGWRIVSHWAGVAQLVEHQPSKLRVAGPSPVSRSNGPRGSVVEHFLGKEGVTGSIPVVGSRFAFLRSYLIEN
jgi:hypothetical protein